jgi:hypothetical protein
VGQSNDLPTASAGNSTELAEPWFCRFWKIFSYQRFVGISAGCSCGNQSSAFVLQIGFFSARLVVSLGGR